MGRWQRWRKSLKTSDLFHPLAVRGNTLRPGGLTLTRSAVEFCALGRDDLVLDAGCGYGATTRSLCEEYGIMAVGVDLSQEMVTRAKENISARGDREDPWLHSVQNSESECQLREPQFVRSRLPLLPFRSSRFKALFCECVLSLIQERQQCLGEFFRILENSGWLILTDLYIKETQYTSKFSAKLPAETISPHQGNQKSLKASCLDGAMTISSLTRAVEEAGFQIDLAEDHTALLRELAGQMVFDHGSLDNFWKKLTGNLCSRSLAGACRREDMTPGYCMIIASKHDDYS